MSHIYTKSDHPSSDWHHFIDKYLACGMPVEFVEPGANSICEGYVVGFQAENNGIEVQASGDAIITIPVSAIQSFEVH